MENFILVPHLHIIFSSKKFCGVNKLMKYLIITIALAYLSLLPDLTARPLAYVSNERSNSVTVIDTATDEVVDTIAVGARPRGIGLSPDGSILYLALGRDDTIGVVDTKNGKQIGGIPSGSRADQAPGGTAEDRIRGRRIKRISSLHAQGDFRTARIPASLHLRTHSARQRQCETGGSRPHSTGVAGDSARTSNWMWHCTPCLPIGPPSHRAAGARPRAGACR